MVQTKTDTLKLHIVEEQEIYRELYRHVLPEREGIELLQVSPSDEIETIRQKVAELRPDVLLLSIKKLNGVVVGELEHLIEPGDEEELWVEDEFHLSPDNGDDVFSAENDAVEKLMENHTSLIIAHRLSTIQHCDRIVVLHKGEIQEVGTHAELIRKRGIYFRLYQLQYKEQLGTGTWG